MYNLVEYWISSIQCWFFIPENQSAEKLFQHWNTLPIRSKVKSYVTHEEKYSFADVQNYKESKGGFKEELTKVHYPSVNIEILV